MDYKLLLGELDNLSKDLDAKVIMNLDPILKKKFKEQFTQFFSAVLYDELELRLVIDANIVIAGAIAKTQGKKDIAILDSPHIKVFGPPKLVTEIENNLPTRAREENLNIDELKRNADFLLSKITIISPNEKDLLFALEITKTKDVKDAPYVGLIFTTKSHGVMTKNEKHYSNLRGVEIINIGTAGKILTHFELGTFSFFALGTGMPTIFELFFNMLAFVFKMIIIVIKELISLIVLLISSGINSISKMGWLGVILLTIVIIYFKENIALAIKQIWIKVCQFFKFISEAIGKIFLFFKEMLIVILEITAFLAMKIQKAIEVSQQLRVQQREA